MNAPVFIGADLGDPTGDVGVVQIGPHRLYQADAYTLRRRLGVEEAGVMDPPYRPAAHAAKTAHG